MRAENDRLDSVKLLFVEMCFCTVYGEWDVIKNELMILTISSLALALKVCSLVLRENGNLNSDIL